MLGYFVHSTEQERKKISGFNISHSMVENMADTDTS